MLKAAIGCVVLSLQVADALHEPACCARHNTHSTLLCRMCLIRDGHFGAPRTSSRHISLRGGRSEILDEKIENGKSQIQSEQLKEAHVVMRGVLTVLAFTSFSSLFVLLIPFGGALFEFPSDNLFPVGQSCVMNVHIMARYTHSIRTSSHQHTHSKHYDAMNFFSTNWHKLLALALALACRAHTHPRALSFSLSYTQPGPLLLAKLRRY
jgi:hypothetical protein